MYRSAHVDLADPSEKSQTRSIIFRNDDKLSGMNRMLCCCRPVGGRCRHTRRGNVHIYAGMGVSLISVFRSFTSSRVALAGAWPPDMFLSREALEEASPSRQHGIDGRLEASYRWSYCEFLKDSGTELKMCGFLLLVITRHLRTRNQAHATFNTSHLAGLN